MEYPHARGKYRKNFSFSLEFRTEQPDGLLFYAANADRDHYVAVFLWRGKVRGFLSDG